MARKEEKLKQVADLISDFEGSQNPLIHKLDVSDTFAFDLSIPFHSLPLPFLLLLLDQLPFRVC